MIIGTATLLILLLALMLDRIVGDPDILWRRFPHPVVHFGNAISWAEGRLNKPDYSSRQREKNGFLTIAVLIILTIFLGAAISKLFLAIGWIGLALEVLIVAVFLAQKSLADHVGAVANGLRSDGIEGGRHAVSMIVGRRPDLLDEPGVCRAAIESLAENASDGVVAPAFWYAVFGLPGLFAYKMLNTADSMIGHRNERFEDFGRASARFDDLANWLPARLTGVLIVLAGDIANIEENFLRMMRDAKLHRSPNAGWPESAMAAVTGLSLGGPRIYDGDMTDEPFMNEVGRKDAGAADIDKAIKIFWRAMSIGTVFVFALTVLWR